MTWFADLGPIDYFPAEYSKHLRAVGWLESGHAFTTGHTPSTLILKLFRLSQDPWSPCLFLGWHDCTLCNQADGPHGIEYQAVHANIGTHNMFIPGPGTVFVAPTMILHYILDHAYQPPAEFLSAIAQCPEMNTEAYFEALRAGLTEFH